MTNRSHTLVFTLVIASTLMLFPSTARLQEKTEPDAVVATEPTTSVDTEPTASVEAEPTASVETEPAASGAEENNTYIIVQGDTLWDIANSALKDPFLWPLIWKENPFITNPDLIYPGNRLTIPGLAPIERAMQAQAEPAAKTVPSPLEQAEKADTDAAPAVPASPRTTAAPEQKETPAKPGLIVEKEAVRPLIDKYTMISAGYITTDTWAESIAGTLEPKAMLGFDDVVFISVNDPDKVKIGDRFLIFSPVKNVKHPQTGKKMGRLIKILGILQVVEKAPGAAYLTARISLSFDSISKGSLLAPYQEPTLFYSVPPNESRNIDGHIVEVMDSRSINGNFDMLYLDKGGNDGVKPGDRFMVVIDPRKKSFPKKIIGEAQVVLVKDTSATALVKSSTDPIAKGDRVELIK